MSLSFTDFFKPVSKTLTQHTEWTDAIKNGGVVTPDPVDPTTTTFSLAAAATSAKEGAAGTWTLTLANSAADQAYSVNLTETFGGTAATEDVGTLAVTGATFADGVVTFDAGITAATITVPFLKDAFTPEANESVVLTISNPSDGAVLNAAHTAATVAITDVATADGSIAVIGGNVAPGENAADANLTFQFTAGTYDYTIAGFATGDVLDFPDGSLISVSNTDFADGNVDVLAVTNDKTMSIHLTGLATPESFSLSSEDGFNTVFGAGSLI